MFFILLYFQIYFRVPKRFIYFSGFEANLSKMSPFAYQNPCFWPLCNKKVLFFTLSLDLIQISNKVYLFVFLVLKQNYPIPIPMFLIIKFCPLPYQKSFFSNKNTNLLGAHWKIIGLDTQVPRQLKMQANKTVLTPASPANSNASKPKVLEKGATSVEEWSIFHWQQNIVIFTCFSVF